MRAYYYCGETLPDREKEQPLDSGPEKRGAVLYPEWIKRGSGGGDAWKVLFPEKVEVAPTGQERCIQK